MEFSMRITILLLAGLPLMVADSIDGKWMLGGDVAGNAVNLICTMEQVNAPKFTGDCNLNEGKSVMLRGETKGELVKFAYTTSVYTLSHTGRIKADTMNGEIEVEGATGTFTGKRTEQGGKSR